MGKRPLAAEAEGPLTSAWYTVEKSTPPPEGQDSSADGHTEEAVRAAEPEAQLCGCHSLETPTACPCVTWRFS